MMKSDKKESMNILQRRVVTWKGKFADGFPIGLVGT